MPLRILSLLLCLLVAGPMSLPAHAVARPENRVEEFFPATPKSASADLDQTAGLRWENRGCDYDFASGVCKYLYAHNNPVNRIDPSGHESLASVNFSMAIISQMVMHDLRGANGALKGARALFGSDDSLDSIIYGLDVIGIVDEKVGQVALGAAGVYGGIKVAGWIKNTFGSTRIAQEVLASLKQLAAKFPGRPKPSGELGQYIYRTISPHDPHYQQFKNIGDKGSIAPRGGHNDLTRHVQDGDTQSIFVSWSKDQDANWNRWNGAGSIQLRIKVSELENPALDVSQWSRFPTEEEVTVIGTISNAERVR